MTTNKLIVIEGIDGSGKLTQLQLLAEYFNAHQIKYASFDFPQYGKTFFGDFARRFLKGEFGHFSRINPYLASFPYAADRWQVKDKIWQAIKENKIIICNRYTPSSIYQAAKIKLSERQKFLDWVETLEYEVFAIPRPSLVIFLYVPLIFAQTLIIKKSKDQYEKDLKYLKKVENLYLDNVRINQSWVKIDCVNDNKIISPKEINGKITDILEKKGYVPTTHHI